MGRGSFLWIFLLMLFQTYAQTLDIDKHEKKLKSAPLKQKHLKSDVQSSSEGDSLPTSTVDTESIAVLGITVPPELLNDTVVLDHHTYYNSTFYTEEDQAKRFWIDIDGLSSPANVHNMLSNSHRQATTVELTFDFPFYGHYLKNITIATGGFLYMGDYLHNWIAATQYVAPLMANFDTSQSTESLIKYADNGTAFVAQWENVFIQNRLNDGGFTFQVTLLKSGDIIFTYKNVPYPISNISDDHHPVKLGISDAYILERSLFFVKRKTIYEYHRIDLLKRPISNNTAIYFTALPTCPGYRNCTSCLSADTKLECGWCESMKRCSDGIDRFRQEWVANQCPNNKVKTCPAVPATSTDSTSSSVPTATGQHIEIETDKSPYGPSYNVIPPQSDQNEMKPQFVQMERKSDGIGMGAIITIVAFIVALLAASVWVGYAYKFPQSPSGQFLIKYRPTQWTSPFGAKDEVPSGNALHF